jgi:transposase
VRPKLAWVACETIFQAAAPSRPIARGMAGPALIARDGLDVRYGTLALDYDNPGCGQQREDEADHRAAQVHPPLRL